MSENTTSNSVTARWVMKRYTGPPAKSVAAHANQGIGYFVLERPETGEAWIEVAFTRPNTMPLTDGMYEVTDEALIAKLERWKHGS